MDLVRKILLLLCVSIICQAKGQEIPDSLLRIKYPLHLRYYPGLGIITEAERPADWKLDTEALYQRYATHTLAEVFEDLNYFYSNHIVHFSLEEKQLELEKMREAAHRLKSPKLEEETYYLDAYIPFVKDWEPHIERGMHFVRRLEKEGNRVMAVRIKSELFLKCILAGEDFYSKAYRLAGELIADLEKVTEEEYPQKRYVYGEIGHLYYSFRDYDNALPLLKMALTDKSVYFFDRASLRARNTLGVYYTAMGETDKAIGYYQSILTSPDLVFLRGMFDAIALSNLGRIYAEKGDHEKALRLYHQAIPIAIAENDYNFATGSLIGMGRSYLAQGDLKKTQEIIDTARLYIMNPAREVSPHRYRDLYPLMSKYYLRTGNVALSELYSDSAAIARDKYEQVYNTRMVVKARQEVFEAEKAVREEEIRLHKNRLLLGGVIIILGFITLLIIVYLYRKKNAAYRALVRKSMEWAYTDPPETKALDPEKSYTKKQTAEEDTLLFRQTHERIQNEQLYKDANLTLDSLADTMGVNHAALSRAINSTGKNFKQYINECRVKEAIRIISATTGHRVYLDELYEQVGFNSRISFYRAFKQNTGLAPTEFLKNFTHR